MKTRSIYCCRRISEPRNLREREKSSIILSSLERVASVFFLPERKFFSDFFSLLDFLKVISMIVTFSISIFKSVS